MPASQWYIHCYFLRWLFSQHLNAIVWFKLVRLPHLFCFCALSSLSFTLWYLLIKLMEISNRVIPLQVVPDCYTERCLPFCSFTRNPVCQSSGMHSIIPYYISCSLDGEDRIPRHCLWTSRLLKLWCKFHQHVLLRRRLLRL